MKNLFLDLASHQGILACVSDDRVASSFSVDHRIDDAALVPHIEALLKSAGWSYADLTHLACVVGPGGFTSLRVAVALGNAVGSQLGIPVCGIHLSDVYRLRVAGCGLRDPETRNSKLETFVWLHSTKKHELFVRGFGSLVADFPEPQCVTITDLLPKLKKGIQWMGELIPEQRQVINGVGMMEAALRPLNEVLPEFLKNQKYTKETLVPWYGRGW